MRIFVWVVYGFLRYLECLGGISVGDVTSAVVRPPEMY